MQGTLAPKTTKWGDLIWRGRIFRSVGSGRHMRVIYAYDLVGRDNTVLPVTVQPHRIRGWDVVIDGEWIATKRTKSDAQAVAEATIGY